MTYTSPIWNTTAPRYKKKLEIVQNRIITLIINKDKSPETQYLYDQTRPSSRPYHKHPRAAMASLVSA